MKDIKTNKLKNKVVSRFAPSPTGLLHAGNYRTALFSYIYAKQNKGSFVLRIEDTDKERNKREYEDNILESLKWLGLGYDKIARQSELSAIHRKYLEQMIKSGHAYVSKETPAKAGGRAEVIRFKNPNRKVAFDDLIRGKIEFDTTELGDFVVAKSLDEPVFHTAVVVDDYEMGVTLVIRGEDHISNTARHLLIQEAIGAPHPAYAHVPLVLGSDRSKLSKRKGALPITAYRDRGYLPETLINYMALLGWHPEGDTEIFSIDELIKMFDLSKVQRGGAIFDDVKLNWVNKEHMKKLSDKGFLAHAVRFMPPHITLGDQFEKKCLKIVPLLRERLSNFGEIKEMDAAGDLDIFFNTPSAYPAELLLCPEKQRKGKDLTPASLIPILSHVRETIDASDEKKFTPAYIKELLWPYAELEGRGVVLWSLRVALSGKERSPDPFSLASILGKEETLKRLDDAASKLQKNAQK